MSSSKIVFTVRRDHLTYLGERLDAAGVVALVGLELVVNATVLLQRRELGEALVAHSTVNNNIMNEQ